jgi:hypothetical protein
MGNVMCRLSQTVALRIVMIKMVRWSMKKAIGALFLFAGVLAATPISAQRKYEAITVKNADVQAKVVILAIESGTAQFELQCDTNVSGCNALRSGNYVMVRLPKNWGTYDCANVDVFHTPANSGELGEKLGEYCLIEK